MWKFCGAQIRLFPKINKYQIFNGFWRGVNLPKMVSFLFSLLRYGLKNRKNYYFEEKNFFFVAQTNFLKVNSNTKNDV